MYPIAVGVVAGAGVQLVVKKKSTQYHMTDDQCVP